MGPHGGSEAAATALVSGEGEDENVEEFTRRSSSCGCKLKMLINRAAQVTDEQV